MCLAQYSVHRLRAPRQIPIPDNSPGFVLSETLYPVSHAGLSGSENSHYLIRQTRAACGEDIPQRTPLRDLLSPAVVGPCPLPRPLLSPSPPRGGVTTPARGVTGREGRESWTLARPPLRQTVTAGGSGGVSGDLYTDRNTAQPLPWTAGVTGMIRPLDPGSHPSAMTFCHVLKGGIE